VPRNIVLVGLPGAGKTTVARLVAAALGRQAVDLDDMIAERAGRSIAEIFETLGESGFRALERAATDELRHRDGLVVATGGGWATNPGCMEALAASDVIYLVVDPDEAAARVAGQGTARPLLAGADAAQKIRELLARREASYLLAGQRVDTTGVGTEIVAERVLALASGGSHP